MHTDNEQAQLHGGADQHDQGDPAQQEGLGPQPDRGQEPPQLGKVSLMEVIGMFGGCSSGL